MNCTVSFPIFNGFGILVQPPCRPCHANSGVYSQPLQIFVFPLPGCRPLLPPLPPLGGGRGPDTRYSPPVAPPSGLVTPGAGPPGLDRTLEFPVVQPLWARDSKAQSRAVSCLGSHSEVAEKLVPHAEVRVAVGWLLPLGRRVLPRPSPPPQGAWA